MTSEQIGDFVDEGALTYDGFDSAIFGIAIRPCNRTVVAYDFNTMVAKCIEDGMTYDEALEYIDFNIIGAYMGDGTPIIIRKIDESEL
jgi:hypothetical protein